MKADDIKEFLRFRKKFSKLEWFEINKAIGIQENKRADEIVLNDSDIEEIQQRINDNSFLKIR